MNRRITIIALAILAFGTIMIAGLTQQKNGSGTVELVQNTIDKSDLTVTFDGEPGKFLNGAYVVDVGTHTISVAKPGYNSFSTSFDLKKGQTIVITAPLTLASDPTIKTLDQLQGVGNADTFLGNIEYFYDKSYAVVDLNSTLTDASTVVVRYDAQKKTWNPVLGPGTVFEPSAVTSLPKNVSDYLDDQGLVKLGV